MSHPDGLEFETMGPLRRAVKKVLVDPLANYLPAGLVRVVLRAAKSELAMANWQDPGGWRSMVISYEGKPRQIADKILVSAGAMSMALRNRRKLGARILGELMAQSPSDPVYVLCLGAGPGHIVTDAMLQCRRDVRATMVDISSDAFDYGRQLATRLGLIDKVRFVQADVRQARQLLDRPVDLVKMLGICEYIEDDALAGIARALAGVMAAGAPLVANSLSKAHGNDRFFRRVFGLSMIHRTPRQLQDLLAACGFGDFVTASEPLGVYHILTARAVKQVETS